ncbi:MAG: type-F conjugative transfer system pilin assembly protein TrbC [Maricaulaceae bacterium]
MPYRLLTIALAATVWLFSYDFVSAQDKELQELVDEARSAREALDLSDLSPSEKLLEEARRRVSDIEVIAPDLDRLGDSLGYDLNEEREKYKDQLEETLYIFVSFSMEESLIKSYVSDAAKAGGVVVISGLLNESLKETIEKVEEFVFIDKDNSKGGVLIDPKAFETFAVEQVPTILLAESQLIPCLDAACEREVPPHDRLMGSVSLAYALELFAREGDFKEAAQKKLSRIQRDIYSAYRD